MPRFRRELSPDTPILCCKDLAEPLTLIALKLHEARAGLSAGAGGLLELFGESLEELGILG